MRDTYTTQNKTLRTILALLSLVGVTAALYTQTINHHFLNYDDDVYITANSYIQNGLTLDSLRWAATSFYASNWHPLTWLSHMLDVQLFGMEPGKHHCINMLWHMVNTFLVFFLFQRFTQSFWKSFFAAFLFACHPLHVESVAWIAERKDLLSSFFWLLTLLAYHSYTKKRSLSRYALCFVLYTLGLLAKPMLVTLPFCMLLLDYWPYDRWTSRMQGSMQLVLEKTPFFLLSLVSSLITLEAQRHGGSLVSSEYLSFASRLTTALSAYVFYLNKFIWPTDLAVFYPHISNPSLLQTIMAAGFIAFLCSWTIIRRKQFPHIFVGWFWFLGTLIPVIGIVQVGEQAMADRYMYMPMLGLILIATYGGLFFVNTFSGRKRLLRSFFFFLPLLLLSVVSFRQVRFWHTTQTLFQHTLTVTQNNYLAHFQLGSALAREGKLTEAEFHLKKTIDLRPGTAQAYNNLAYVLERKGDLTGAIQRYMEAAQLDKDNKEARYNLGLIYLRRWEFENALRYLREAQKIDPNDGRIQKNIAKTQTLWRQR